MPQPHGHRSNGFAQEREPFDRHTSLQLARSKVTSPVRFLNPTQAQFRHLAPDAGNETNIPTPGDGSADTKGELEQPGMPKSRAEYRWTSRNNRKGRHQIVTRPPADPSEAKIIVPKKTNDVATVRRTIGRMLTEYPYYDISWLVAYVFTWGSILWVINAFFAWLPLERPSTEFRNEILTGGGITAFIGATIFEIGSIFLMLEAINENRVGCFGWAVHQFFDDQRGYYLVVSPDPKACTHHHSNRSNLVGKSLSTRQHSIAANDEENLSSKHLSGKKSWTWYPSWYDLKSHYLHEIGFLACSAQMFGATIFWISGFTALPGIFNHLSPGHEDGIYWTPQVIGGSGFIVSGTLFMLETQKQWYRPAFDVLGWHIGFWNLVGGVGFTLCPAFGYDAATWAQYQASLSTFWASWAFLIGSLLQLYESLQKHPVDERKRPDRADSQVTQHADQG